MSNVSTRHNVNPFTAGKSQALNGQRLQVVSIGKSQSGKWGLFTGGFMAWPLQYEDVLWFSGNDAALHNYCKHRGFEWNGVWSSTL